MRSLFLVLLSLCVSLVASAAVAPLQERADILSPENDPFYKAPQGWKDEKPGAILRSRKIEAALLTVDKINVEAAYQILYRTTGTHESDPAVTVTTVLVPYNAKRDKLVTHLTYVDADGSQCSLSYAIRKGSELPGDLALLHQTLLLEQTLEAGYIMTLPDYQGKNRAFGAGRLEGRQTLDSIRATLDFDKLNLKKKSPVVVSGYSGGAIASGWTAQLASTYAPELNTVGYAMGGTPANMTGTMVKLDGGLFSAFAVAGVAGLAYAYDDILEWLSPRLTAKGRRAIEFARSQCMIPTLLRYPFSKLQSDDFVKGGANMLHVPAVRNVLDTLVMGASKKETPNAPVFMYHSKNDEVIPYDDAIKAGRNWASHGAHVTFVTNTNPILEHLTTEFVNLPNLLFFFEDRFANKSFPKGFHHKTIDSPLNEPRVQQQALKDLVDIIQNILGDKLGPADAKFKAYIRKHAHN